MSLVTKKPIVDFISCEEDHKGKIEIHCRICSDQDRMYVPRAMRGHEILPDTEQFISRFVDEHADRCYVPTVCQNLEDYDRPVLYHPAPFEQERPLMLDNPFDAKIEELKNVRQQALFEANYELMQECDAMLQEVIHHKEAYKVRMEQAMYRVNPPIFLRDGKINSEFWW